MGKLENSYRTGTKRKSDDKRWIPDGPDYWYSYWHDTKNVPGLFFSLNGMAVGKLKTILVGMN